MMIESSEPVDWQHASWRPLRWLLPMAWLCFAASTPIANIWLRLSLVNAVLIVVTWRTLPLPWQQLWAWPGWRLWIGVGLGLALYGLGGVGFRLLVALAPALALQADGLYSWANQLAPAVALSLLPFIVFGEEMFWRAGVALPLAQRLGPVAGSLASGAAFALAHLFIGPPLLWLAALVFGTVWAAYLVTGRRLWPVYICHLVWDLLAMFLLPYSLW